MEGVVIRSTGSWYQVRTATGIVSCTIRGKFRLDGRVATNPVVIGDHVTLSMNEDGTGLITDIGERHNKLTRRAAGRRVGREHVIVANVDAAWVVQSVQEPKFNGGLVDRFLVMAEAWEIPAGIIINKADLIDERSEDAMDFWSETYRDLGYPVLFTSTRTGVGIPELRDQLANHIHVIVGPSGVGKSSLINALEPLADLRTGEVSERTRKGKHTTTFAELIPLGNGGYVADTPGLREYGLVDIGPAELSHRFVEMRENLHECRYPDCTHDHEPGCRIKEMVEAGEIVEERYESYLNILHSIHMGDKDVGR
ncbi:MAG: ribosome small subunit-dependent GTPase A [Rhodothermales bacterium]